MAVSVTKLKGFIQTYSGYSFENISEQEGDELKSFVTQAVFSVRWEMEDDLNNLKEGNEKKQYVLGLQFQLTYMADGIGGFNKDNKKPGTILPILLWLQNSIFELLDHIQTYFGVYFDFGRELPVGFVEQFKPGYASFENISGKLAEAQVDPDLSLLIRNFAEATDKSERFKIRNWRQWDFLVKTTLAIDHFFDNIPKGDIDLELLKMFICLEFNSIQVYAYFLKYIERITLAENSFQDQKQQLLYLLKVFKQVRIEAEYRYDRQVLSLKTSILESLHAEINYLEDKQQLFLQQFKSTNPEAPSKFYFTVMSTLAELMFLFRLMLEVGFVETKFNSYLYEFVSNHIRTKNAENISKKSQRNHFNNKPFPDRVVQNVRLWLTKMTNHLDLYYKAKF
jgi:hypothetical protein